MKALRSSTRYSHMGNNNTAAQGLGRLWYTPTTWGADIGYWTTRHGGATYIRSRNQSYYTLCRLPSSASDLLGIDMLQFTAARDTGSVSLLLACWMLGMLYWDMVPDTVECL